MKTAPNSGGGGGGGDSGKEKKRVVVRNIKAMTASSAFYMSSYQSRIRYVSPFFRLFLVHDPAQTYTPHAVAPWLPQPADKATHKRRHMRLLTGELVEAHGGLDSLHATLGEVSSGAARLAELAAEARSAKIDLRLNASSAEDADEEADKEGKEEDDDDDDDDCDPFDTLGEQFDVPKPRGFALKPLPWPEREIELRTFFVNSKKETHKLAVVRSRCRRRIQALLDALFLPLTNGRRKVLGQTGAMGLAPADLQQIIHTDYVYTFVAQPIVYSAEMEAMAQELVKAFQETSRLIIGAEAKRAAMHQQRKGFTPQQSRRPSDGGARTTFNKRPNR
ncbi:hypothetical protein OC834_002988 [Tilletia horrida]|nr:hypothetical protein OC834_002988 [Tilletia horrida]